MIKRQLTSELLETAGEYPVVTIVGPRQSGKTTLAQMTFPDKAYISLEEPDNRAAAEIDPRGFLGEMLQGGIIDEIQRVPQLLSYIQGIVDKRNESGMFILTGSHQPELHHAISQSLAGRTALLTLLPFSVDETIDYSRQYSAFQFIVRGMYPRVYEKDLKPSRFYGNYFQTYIERDVRSIIQLKDLRQFQQFMKLLAGRIGQVVNYTALSNDVGVSSTTIKNWISVLKASYVLFELPPWFSNIRKRVIKSSKLFFTDTGLACFLCNISTPELLNRDPLRGGLYENFIILEFLKAAYNRGIHPDFYFYRDSHGNEVDLVIKHNGLIIPVEIKSAATFNPEFLKGINRFKKASNLSANQGLLIYNGENQYNIEGTQVLNPFLKPGFWRGFFKV